MVRKMFVGAALVLMGLSTTGASGQDSLLDELYGRGVHAYFSRDYRGAESALNAAIDGGSRDPRAYYFRGLTNMVIGKSAEGAADFKTGATLEVAATDRAYAVARSLERIQGPMRRAIETERQMARVVSRQKLVDKNKARYEQLESAEKTVIRGAAKPAPGDLPKLPAPEGVDPDDPFSGVEGATPAPKPAVDPAPTPEDPDAEMPAKPDPAGDDPFGDKPAAPAKPAVPPKPVPADDDPFGDKPAAPAKPEPAKPEPAEPEAPAKPEPADDDPFAEKPAAPAKPEPAKPEPEAGEPAEEMPAKPEPAKPEAPAKPEPAGDDPFADDPAPAGK